MRKHTPRNISKMAILSVLMLYAIPGLHPLLMPVTGVTSHLLWWTHVAPVSLVAYFFGVRGGMAATAVSTLLLVAGERFFGNGYGEPATWETAWSLAVALAMTNLLVAMLAITAGRAARTLSRAAYTHSLTGLPNRQYLESLLAQKQSKSNQQALVFVDLDDFDTINYSLGHDAGDHVLIALSRRFRACLENEQVLAHWAGDKFVVYAPSGSMQEIDTLVHRLQRSLSQPLEIGTLCLRSLTAGFGIACQEYGNNTNDLARNADTALSRAKQQGSSGRCVFEQSMQDNASYRLSILNDLSHAITHGKLMNYYQPIHHAASKALVGLETLVRWPHPDKGMIAPDEFIPMAEHAGLIAQLGEVVLEQALLDFQYWRKQGLCEPDMFLNINISPLQLVEHGFTDLLSSAVKVHEIPPHLLVLEITETAMMQSETVSLRILHDLRSRGFRIAIDDFGSGYSSLNYLHKLPVQILKIDRALIEQMENSQQAPLVKPIVEIARALGLQVIAEGVETATQAAQLAELDVDFLQGYYLSRPMPQEDLYPLVRPVSVR
tara:strand:+ start:37480 stop:39126 length:1647 start_codon:yes stop_codon:yes gene_type:complete